MGKGTLLLACSDRGGGLHRCDACRSRIAGRAVGGDRHGELLQSTGTSPFFFPELEVGGLGEIAFPMIAAQVRELVGRAEKAPYGQGARRRVRDEAVRKCWQLDAAEFRFGGGSGRGI